MPKNTDIKSIMIIGAGPIIVGQACEFDYSGTQGAKVLKEEGYRVILVNSNPATIMTDEDTADKIYLEPLTEEIIIQILEKERPDVILPTLGGQTALNLTLELSKSGILDKLGVGLIGVNVEAIEKAENREKFRKLVEDIKIWSDIDKKFVKLKCPRSVMVSSWDDSAKLLKEKNLKLPLVIRPSLTLGGTGCGIARNSKNYEELVKKGLEESPIHQIQVDEDLTGWKEYELEVIRDKNDNAIVVCSIENIDQMGIHTGDSITVAPAMTLTDKEYQFMRDASLEILRKVGVETGGSNVQFAINPKNGDMVVIEMNPRVSRSSALVSKATGFPIAKVAAKLAIGYTLDEIKNDIACGIPKDMDYLKFKNVIAKKEEDEKIEKYLEEQRGRGVTETQLMQKVLPASFEPSIDYVVVKIPKFNFEKFGITKPVLGIQMQSIGEVMAIGRTFSEALKKALDSLEKQQNFYEDIDVVHRLKINSPSKILDIFKALKIGYTIEEVSSLSGYDKWFVEQIYYIVFEEDDRGRRTVFKKIDTCANEFETNVNYFYSTKEVGYKKIGTDEIFYDNETERIKKKKVIILGSGANRIGQGIEFDYACVQASKALREINIKTIMVNSNPETVSTDYDVSDRLYFEPVVDRYVQNIILNELDITIKNTKVLDKYFTNLRDAYEYFEKMPNSEKTEEEIKKITELIGEHLSVAIGFGGQTALNMRGFLKNMFVSVFGSGEEAIEICDNREAFENFCKKIGILRPLSNVCHSDMALDLAAQAFNYKFIIRPISVIGGRGMSIIKTEEEYKNYLSIENGYLPCVVDEFLENAREFDIDLIKDKNGKIFIGGILEQLEYAGVHSGDSMATLLDYDFDSKEEKKHIVDVVLKIVKNLDVQGAINIQIAIKDDKIYTIEVNPRISRTLPFISKAIKYPLVILATKIMAGMTLEECLINNDQIISYKDYKTFKKLQNFYVKGSVFSFEKFSGSNMGLGPEMRSTGEVIGIGKTFNEALIKTLMGARISVKKGNIMIISSEKKDQDLIDLVNLILESGYKILAVENTYKYLKNNHLNVDIIDNISIIKNTNVCLLISIVRDALGIDFLIRREAILRRIPYSTNIETAKVLVNTLKEYHRFNNIKVVE
ncbi:MAG: ATP-grasp domain-containing protein [Rickettsiales bacterium]|jgi:carbamoyl-phosphate synthase large subunit|nr:ATP-grasp domain-containing protein [Rickettsiales bacterium]